MGSVDPLPSPHSRGVHSVEEDEIGAADPSAGSARSSRWQDCRWDGALCSCWPVSLLGDSVANAESWFVTLRPDTTPAHSHFPVPMI